MKLKFVIIALCTLFIGIGIGNAVEYDPIDHDCAEPWGNNVTCLGLVPASEITNPNSHFRQAVNEQTPYPAIWSPFVANDITATPTSAKFEYFRYDNKRNPIELPESNRIVIKAKKAGYMIPQVTAMLVSQPDDDCTPDEDWHINDVNNSPVGCPDGQLPPEYIIYPNIPENYPIIIYHIDWVLSPEAQEICENSGWDFTPGSPCDIVHQDNSGNGLPDAWGGTKMRVSAPYYKGTEIENAVRVGSADIYYPHWEENANYNYMKYNTGTNAMYSQGIWEDHNSVYFGDIAGILPLGTYTWQVNFKDGTMIEFTSEVFYDHVMPVVAAENMVYQEVTNKSGKAIKGLSGDVAVPNLTAREIDGKLIIQWAEPDAALTLPNGTRLRIFVGDGWINKPTDGSLMDYDFLWMDCPLHTGSVVVPVEQYEWIKEQMRQKSSNTVEIGGMYRQQYDWYDDEALIGISHHNRGYFEGITHTFE